MNKIEICNMKNNGIAFRAVKFPARKHYVLQLGRTEARIIIDPESRRPYRSFAALVFAIAMFKMS
jgi:hypothetical protein